MDETIQRLINISVENAVLKEQLRCFEIVTKMHCKSCEHANEFDSISREEAIPLIFNQ